MMIVNAINKAGRFSPIWKIWRITIFPIFLLLRDNIEADVRTR